MEIPSEAPVMTLPGVTLFPETLLPLHIFEPRYRRMLAEVLRSHRMFVVAMPKPGTVGTPTAIAGLGFVRVCVGHNDGTSHLVLQGLSRVEILGKIKRQPYPTCQIRPLRAPARDSVAIDALLARVRDLVLECIHLGFASSASRAGRKSAKAKPPTPSLTVPDIMGFLDKINNPDKVADLVSSALLSRAAHKQIILETVEVEPRLKYLIHFLMGEISQCQKKPKSGQ